ncbi:dehydrogenase [Eilatimonas milleporae]|uniref:D-glycero-alpha-D-manno-heptose-7-phosphate kinase n=1 Tax=Eilatimonas milleporae TaxID=911205 RepID=A0A3M0BT16_9PROT|nr:dehydrogenase [Eilatimonas milleporae]RMB00661.1 D-glycero-alpha-D-manno-heptose-7-phosphate kinase [Eilatimonas milleporae]
MSLKKIRARAPLRLGLAGGGTDVSPFCDRFGGAILNFTIDRYAYATLEEVATDSIEFTARDLKRSVSFSADTLPPVTGDLKLHRGVYRRIMEDFNGGKSMAVRLVTSVDSPIGSGLGSSSSLVVAMIEAFRGLMNLPLGEYEVAQLAFRVEREDLGLAGGRQDQFAATFGGVNFMEFHEDNRVIVNPLRIRSTALYELEASLLLHFSGVSRESARIIESQSKAAHADHDSQQLKALHDIKNDAYAIKDALMMGDIERMAEVISNSWEAKKKTSSKITSAAINHTIETALNAGALAAKVSGAGGGGFMYFLVDPEMRANVQHALSEHPGYTSLCHLTTVGSEFWSVKREA